MIISHHRRFIVFADPLGAGDAVLQALSPWNDVDVTTPQNASQQNAFYAGMTPQEVAWQFDGMGLAFHSYLRISVVEHPFSRMARLYDRIAQTDAVWKIRQLAGIGLPDFETWLRNTQPDGFGAGSRNGPRWRQHAAWSAKVWEAGIINHTIRAEAIEEDLTPVLAELGVAPSLNIEHALMWDQEDWMNRYSTNATAIMMKRYGWDMAQYGYVAPRFRRAA